MTPSEVIEFARDSSLVLARDVNLPQDDVRTAFETIRAAEESSYSVLYTVTGQDETSRNWMAVLCRSMHEATKMQETIDGSTHVGVYALQKTYTTSTTNTMNTNNTINTTAASLPRRSRPSLLPGGPLFLRNYNVVDREEAERRAATSAVAPPTPPVKPIEPTASVEAERTESAPEINTVNVREELPVTRMTLTAIEVVAPAIKEEVPQQEKVKELPKESAEKKKKQQQQQTLFGSMLGGEKHARESTVHLTKAEPKTKKSRSAKASDETVNKNTTSLLKLAKASKKNKVNTGDLTKATSTNNNITNTKISSTYKSNGQGFLDEDEELDNCNGNSNHSDNNSRSRSNSFSRDREFMNEEQQNLDIVITSVTNDDIIICDDAPPMVFCAPETSISPLKKEQQQQQKQCGASATSLDQPKLTGFFHPEVGAFQNKYIRDVKTETVFENDEYISRDVVYYRHKENGELISEEEYHRRSIEVSRKLCEQTRITSSTSCTPSDATSPAAESKERTFIEAARNCRPPNVERQVRSQPKTLMSYFKSTSS